MRIEIEKLPPSQNEWKKWSWTVGGRAKQRRIKREWENLIIPHGYLWKALYGPGIYAKEIKVIFYFPDNRRRDLDNFSYFKGILDGLVKAGIIADDSVKNVKIEYEMKLNTGKRQTEILIDEKIK